MAHYLFMSGSGRVIRCRAGSNHFQSLPEDVEPESWRSVAARWRAVPGGVRAGRGISQIFVRIQRACNGPRSELARDILQTISPKFDVGLHE